MICLVEEKASQEAVKVIRHTCHFSIWSRIGGNMFITQGGRIL